jgi:LPS sulfotransferase NodH
LNVTNTLENFKKLNKWIDCNNVYVIHLIRNNFLKKIISIERMKKSKIAHVSNDKKFDPIFIKLDDFFKELKKEKQKQKYYSKKFAGKHKYLELTYEDLFKDLNSSILKILHFFNIDNEDMDLPHMRKISTNDITKEIINYKEVISALNGT